MDPYGSSLWINTNHFWRHQLFSNPQVLQRLILRQGVEQLLHRLALLLQQLPGNVEGREATGTQTNIQCQWLNMIYMIYIYDIYIYDIYIYISII